MGRNKNKKNKHEILISPAMAYLAFYILLPWKRQNELDPIAVAIANVFPALFKWTCDLDL